MHYKIENDCVYFTDESSAVQSIKLASDAVLIALAHTGNTEALLEVDRRTTQYKLAFNLSASCFAPSAKVSAHTRAFGNAALCLMALKEHCC